MNRREFLKLSAASAISILLSDRKISAATANKKIDFHSHAILKSYVDGLKLLKIDAEKVEGFPLPKWSVEDHLKFMSDAKIDFSILSMATPHIFNGDKVATVEVARMINEEFADICRNFSDKFAFAATIPLPTIEGSINEIKYSMDKLGAIGVKVPSNCRGIYLGDEQFDPIFAELNRRESIVIIHPSPAEQLPRENVITGRVMALFEYPADTTRAVLNLLANGTLEKFPKIKFIIPHCGSFLPYMKQRASAMFKMLASMNIMQSIDIESGIKKLYFDLAGDPMPEELDILLKITDVDHIVYGSDYPYVPAKILLQKKKFLDEELQKRQWIDQIYSENAKFLLTRR